MIPKIKSAWVKIENFTNAQNRDNRFHRLRGTILRFSNLRFWTSLLFSFSNFLFNFTLGPSHEKIQAIVRFAYMLKIYPYTGFWNGAFIYTKFLGKCTNKCKNQTHFSSLRDLAVAWAERRIFKLESCVWPSGSVLNCCIFMPTTYSFKSFYHGSQQHNIALAVACLSSLSP